MFSDFEASTRRADWRPARRGKKIQSASVGTPERANLMLTLSASPVDQDNMRHLLSGSNHFKYTKHWTPKLISNIRSAIYFGVEPSDFVRAVGPKFLVGAVARAFRPGCKNDTCLVLEGHKARSRARPFKCSQGIGSPTSSQISARRTRHYRFTTHGSSNWPSWTQ